MKIARHTFWYLLAALFQHGPAYLLLPWWSRYLTRADFAVSGTLQVYGWFAGHLLSLGLSGAAFRFFYDRRDAPGAQRDQMRTLVLFQLLWSVSGALVLWATGPVWWPAVSSGGIPWARHGAAALLIAAGESLTQIPLSLLMARGRARDYALIQFGRGVLQIALTWWFVVHQGGGALGWLRAQAGTAACSGLFLAAAVLVRARGGRWEPARLSSALRYGLPLVPHLIGMWVIHGMARVVVERHVPQDMAGLFNLASQLALTAYVFICGLSQAWSPVFYEAASRGAEADFFRRSLSLYWTVGSLLTCLGLLLVRPVLLLFPEHLHAAAPLAYPQLVAMFAFGGYSLYSTPLNFHHKTHLIPWLTAIAAAASFLLQALLVPSGGVRAAGWISALSFTLLAGVFGVATRVVPGVRPRGLLAAACLAAPAALALYLESVT